jgi:hypothetical protein
MMEQAIAALAAFQRELVYALGMGAFFGLFMFVSQQLLWRATRDEVNRLLISDQLRWSTYVLMGVAFASVGCGLTLLVKLPGLESGLIAPAARLAGLLFLIGLFTMAIMGSMQAKRLARQLVALRGLRA